MQKRKSDLYKVKMSDDELHEYMVFKRRGYTVKPKKGKGAPYKRNKRKENEYD